MKKLLLATAITALSLSAAHAAPKVYGKLFLSTDYVTNKDYTTVKGQKEDASTWKLNSNASRFGLKGEDELTPTLSAVYQLEFGVGADEDQSVTTSATLNGTKVDTKSTNIEKLTARNRFIGLKSTELGTIKVGRFDTAVKESQNKVDVFNDFVGEELDMKKVLTGEKRANNVIGYESPEIEGLPVVVNAQILLDETTSTTSVQNNSKNGASLSIAFKQAGIYAAVAADQKVGNAFAYNSTSVPVDTIRLVGQFDLGELNVVPGLTVGVLVQNAEPHNSKQSIVDKEEAYLLSTNLKIAAVEGLSVFAQYQTSSTSFVNSKTNKDLDREQLGAGVGYAFSKNTSVYGYLAQQQFDVGTTTIITDKTNYLGLGIEHKF